MNDNTLSEDARLELSNDYKERARKLYAQAADWITAHQQDDLEQQRFQAEAERLILGTQDSSGSNEEGDSASAAQD